MAAQASSVARGWGLHPSADARFHWGARAILRDGVIDLVWDRQGVEGAAADHERTALAAWLNEKAMPWMRAYAKHGEDFPSGDEDREVSVSGDGYKLRANPRSSYGYLYMSAEPCASASHATPTYPIPKSAKRTRRSA